MDFVLEIGGRAVLTGFLSLVKHQLPPLSCIVLCSHEAFGIRAFQGSFMLDQFPKYRGAKPAWPRLRCHKHQCALAVCLELWSAQEVLPFVPGGRRGTPLEEEPILAPFLMICTHISSHHLPAPL